MDFLKALAEAQQQGFTKKEFTNIWEVETKIVQMKEESKLMELKLEYEKLPVKETGSEITKQQLDSIVQQHCMEHQKQLLELKEECHKQNELHTKKISKLLETQASLVALVIRNETEAVLKQFPNSKSKAPPESNAHAGFVKSSNPGLPQNDTQRQQQSKNKDQPQMQVPSEKMRKIDEDLDSMIPRLPQDGAEFHVESLSSIVLSSSTMDIAEVRNLAQERGLTEDEFAKVWETEQKIRLLKDENKALEVKLAGRKLQGLVSSEPTQAAASDVLPLPKHSEMHEQPLLELRKQLQQQNHCHIQEMATLVKKQDISLSQVVKRELSRAVIERKKAVSCEFESNSFDACSERSHSTVTGSQKSVLQPVKTNEKLGKPNTQSQTVKQKQQTKKEDNKINDYYSHMPKPATDSALPVSSQKSYEATSCLLGNGNTLRVPKAKEFAASNDLAFSNYHILSKCPCKVRLCLWFGSKKELNVHILLHGIEDKPLDRPTVFKGAGFILHKSGSFSPLFEATSQELMELTSATDLHIIASVQLKTNSLKSNNVSLKLLEQRDFTIDNSLSIKWFVTAETSN